MCGCVGGGWPFSLECFSVFSFESLENVYLFFQTQAEAGHSDKPDVVVPLKIYAH